MPDAIDSVKALAADYRRLARNSEADNPDLATRQGQRADALESVVQELDIARKRLRPLSPDFGDLSDLPEEVIQHLNLSKVDELEQQLRDIVASGEGSEVGLDQVIIELWRRHKVTKSRTYVMNRLYRMAQKGSIHSVEGKKGVYCVLRNWDMPKQGFADDLDDDIPF